MEYLVALFYAAAAYIVYILLGYPLLLAVLSRKQTRPVRRSPSKPRLTMIVAVHNGERFVRQKLESVFAVDYPPDRLEIILACDGCTDRTAEVAEETGQGRVRVLRLPRGGKALALNAAMKEASGEILVFNDVRQALDPDCLRYLVESFADPQVGVVSGHLVIRHSESKEEEAVGLYWRYEFWIRTQLSRIDSFFGATGACYAIRAELAVPIAAGAILDDMYLPLAAFFRGYRLIVDERARVFDYPTGLETEFNRKVRTLAGNFEIIRAYPALLSLRNRMLLHFLSYKFGRLLLPLALITVALSSFALPRPWCLAALGFQGLIYGLALVDGAFGPRNPIKRLSSVCRTFCVLMLATTMAMVRAMSGHSADDLWKTTVVSANGSKT